MNTGQVKFLKRGFCVGVLLVMLTGVMLAAYSQADSSAPTALSQVMVEAVDTAGGNHVSRGMALLIVGLPIIFLYRVLQWLGGRMKVPVGGVGLKLLTAGLTLFLGSEAAWKNRVLASWAPPDVAKDEKQRLLNKLSKDNPLVNAELKKITDEMFNRAPRNI